MSNRDNPFLGFSLTQMAIAGFGLAVATLLAVGVVQHRAMRSVVDSDFWVTHTYTVLFELEAFQAELQAAEAASRNYMLTGDETYLRQYDTSVSRLTKHLAAVRRLTSDNPRQQRNLDQYEPLVQRKLQLMQALITTRREKGFDAAFGMLRTGQGLQLMNQLRSGVEIMTDEEDRLLTAREPEGRANARNADIVVALGSLLALCIVVVVCTMLIRGSLERRRAEATLQRQAALIDQTYDPILVWDFHGPITFWNRGAEKLYGFTRREAVGRVSHELLQTTTAGGTDAFLSTLDRAGQWEGELQHTTRDGRRIRVQSNMVLIKDAQGVQVLEANRDITEGKHAEEVRSYLAAIVDSSDDAIFGKTIDGIIESWNAGAEKLYGYQASEIIGQPIYRIVPPHLHDEIAGILAALKRGERISHHETVRVRKDGNIVNVSVSVSPLRGAEGDVIGASSIARDISERKKAEEELLFKTALLEAESETTLDGILVVDRSGRILLSNRRFRKMWSIPDGTIRAHDDRSVLETVLTELKNPDAFVEKMRYLYAHETEKSRDEIEFKDGKVFDRYSSPLQDSTGKLHGRVWYFRDISERKRAELALRESEMTLRLFVQHSPAAIAMLDDQMRYLVVSERWVADYQLGNREIQGLSHYTVFPEVPDHWKETYLRCLEGQVERCEEDSFLRSDGQLDWVRWEVRPWRKIDGQIGGIIIFSELITERKKAEAERLRLVTAIEQSAEGVMITTTNGEIEYVNPAFTAITGYSREEAMGQNSRLLNSGSQDPDFYRRLWTTILRGELWHGELVNRRKDGNLYTEELNVAPVRNEVGQVTHFIATMQDVTERRRLEVQFRQAQKMEAVGRLAGGVAHDFNNLLTVINGYSEMMLDGLDQSNPGHEPLEQINKAGVRAASLTRQLLAFSRQQVLAPQVLDLNAVVLDVDKMLRRLIGEDIELRTIRDPNLGRVKADPGQVDQILVNLAVNARDAMPEGGKLTIETANAEFDEDYAKKHPVVSQGRYVMLAVSDTGLGMDSVTQARIFEPFFTTKEKGKGTGLGLSMVYGTVKQSGGFIWVYSEPNQGTTFKIYLPRVENADESMQHSELGERLGKGSETILLVEDEDAVRALAAEILRSQGYKVLESASPEQALEISAQYKDYINLLLTDVVLPGMSGRRVAEHVSSVRPGVKILYMSGYTDNAILHRGVLDANTAFLQKPFGPSTLTRKVREVLDVRT